MLLIETSVLVFGQLDHSGSDGSIDSVVGGWASVAVDQAGDPAFQVGLLKTLDLALRSCRQGPLLFQAALSWRLRSKKPGVSALRCQVVEDDDSALLSSVHNDPAIHEVTESLFASGVTDSLYSHSSPVR